ncbi:MAG: hypothetical protein RR385_07670 [Clostridiales bacterium]
MMKNLPNPIKKASNLKAMYKEMAVLCYYHPYLGFMLMLLGMPLVTLFSMLILAIGIIIPIEAVDKV